MRLLNLGFLALLVAAPATFAESDIQRRSDGKPDLSGTYDIASLTPMQRSQEIGERRFLTPQEAAAIAGMKEEYSPRDTAPSDPDRGAPEQVG